MVSDARKKWYSRKIFRSTVIPYLQLNISRNMKISSFHCTTSDSLRWSNLFHIRCTVHRPKKNMLSQQTHGDWMHNTISHKLRPFLFSCVVEIHASLSGAKKQNPFPSYAQFHRMRHACAATLFFASDAVSTFVTGFLFQLYASAISFISCIYEYGCRITISKLSYMAGPGSSVLNVCAADNFYTRLWLLRCSPLLTRGMSAFLVVRQQRKFGNSLP